MKIKGAIISGIILLGIGLCVTGYAATRDDFNYDELSESQFELVEDVFSTNDIEGLKCDIKAENIKIIPTDNSDIKITSKKSEELNYEFNINNNYLNIVQNIEKSWGFIDWNIFNINKTIEPLIIEIPKNCEFDLYLNINAVNLEINNLNFKTVDLKCNAGNIDMNNCNVESLIVDVDAGNLDFNEFTINKLDCKITAGNADFKAKITESATLECSAGNIDVILTDSKDNYTINGVGNGNVKIITDEDASDIDIEFE